ncbi:MAG: hypothetical protein V4714_04810 [Bacteroidota bacterium]
MKKVLFQVAVLMMTTGYVMAAGAIDKKNPTKSSSRVEVVATTKAAIYRVSYSSEKEGTVKVNIYDAQSNLLYTDYLRNAKKFDKSYDFTGLAEGEYKIEVISVEGKTLQTIYHGIAKEADLTASVASLDQAGKYTLKVQRKQMAPVVVNIYDSNNQLIYQDEITVDQNFTRVYDFTKSFAKAASFEIYSDGALVRQEVK